MSSSIVSSIASVSIVSSCVGAAGGAAHGVRVRIDRHVRECEPRQHVVRIHAWEEELRDSDVPLRARACSRLPWPPLRAGQAAPAALCTSASPVGGCLTPLPVPLPALGAAAPPLNPRASAGARYRNDASPGGRARAASTESRRNGGRLGPSETRPPYAARASAPPAHLPPPPTPARAQCS
eukprot:3564568-Pleurochrysis_carterae.AAC.2